MSIFVKKVQYLLYTRQGAQNYLSMPIENSLWHARIGIFNLSRTYIKKIKVPRFPLINCYFSVLFCRFSFFYYQTIFSFKIAKTVVFNSLHSSHVLF